MKPHTLIALLSFLLLSFSNQAQSETGVAAGLGYDFLSHQFDDWQHQYIRGYHRTGDRNRWRAEARRFDRYSLVNTELSAGLTHQLAPRRVIDGELSLTPNAEFRPQQRALLQLYQGVWQAGGVSLGAQHSNWRDNNSRSFFIEPDYYHGPFRFAARFNWVDLDSVGSSSGFSLSSAWYYQEHSQVTLSYADGREIEPIGDLVVISTVRALALFGQHAFTTRWRLEYALSYTQQGDFHNRRGIEVGLHYRF